MTVHWTVQTHLLTLLTKITPQSQTKYTYCQRHLNLHLKYPVGYNSSRGQEGLCGGQPRYSCMLGLPEGAGSSTQTQRRPEPAVNSFLGTPVHALSTPPLKQQQNHKEQHKLLKTYGALLCSQSQNAASYMPSGDRIIIHDSSDAQTILYERNPAVCFSQVPL